MSKLFLPYAEFYITNVCNLNCPNCNRLNNYKFKGQWEFDQNLYLPWSEKIELEHCTILGGEPTLNPDLPNWIRGIAKLWPNVKGKVNSNGTYLSKCKGLAAALRDTGWELTLVVHSSEMKSLVWQELHNTFEKLEFVSMLEHNGIVNGLKLHSDGIQINVNNGFNFHNNVFSDSNFTLHNSAAEQAHAICTMKKCHHFIDGNLYKCGVVYLVPEFYKQKNLTVPNLYLDYEPISSANVNATVLQTLSEQSIPQCKFCPSKLEYKPNHSKFKSKIMNLKLIHQG